MRLQKILINLLTYKYFHQFYNLLLQSFQQNRIKVSTIDSISQSIKLYQNECVFISQAFLIRTKIKESRKKFLIIFNPCV